MTKIIFADDEGLYEGDLSAPETRDRMIGNGMMVAQDGIKQVDDTMPVEGEDHDESINTHVRNVYDTPTSHGDA